MWNDAWSLRTLLNFNHLKPRTSGNTTATGLRTLLNFNHLKRHTLSHLLTLCLRTLLNFNHLKPLIKRENKRLSLRTLLNFNHLKPQIYFQGFSECFIASPYGSQTYRHLQCRVPSIRVPHWHCKF